MEELYQLIEERLLQIKTAYDKFNLIANQRDHLNTDSISTSGSDVRDLSQYMSQIKRLEKIRTFKENELMEAFSALKSFDSTQKKRFHEKTYYFMKLIRTDFVYAKYKQSEEIKDVAKLFLHFFLHCNMQGKIEEIKKVYSSTKCAGHSFLFLLMKWLIEITRNTLQNLLKEKIQQIPTGAPAKIDKPLAAVPTRIINKIGLTGLRSRSVSKPNPSSTSRPQPSTIQNSPKNGSREVKTPPENLNEIIVKQTAATVNVLKDEDEENSDRNDNNNLPEQQEIILDNEIMLPTPVPEENIDLLLNYKSEQRFKDLPPVSMVEDSTFNFDTTGCFSNHSTQQPQHQPQNQHHRDSHEQLPTVVLNTKHVKQNPFIYNIEGSQVQLYYGNINAVNHYSSLVEDLDIVQASYAYQFLPPKNPRNSKTGTFVTLDMERRKEFINKVFKDLYARNADIEKHAAAFTADMLQERIWSYPHPTNVRKGENFCENITINFPKMFPQLIPDEEIDTDSIPLKGKFARAMNPHRNRKKSDVTSLTLHQKNHSQQQNSKGPRSESSYNSRTQRKSYMDILLNKIQGNRQQPENDDNTGDFSTANGPNPNFGYRTENRFRIMKKKMSIYHEVSPNKSQRVKAGNNSNISSNNNNNNTGNKLMTEASGLFTPDHFSQAITEVLNYIPNMQKEMIEVVQKSSTNNAQIPSNTTTPSYSIYTGNRSTSISKIRPTPTTGGPTGEYTIWDSLNQSKVVIPEKVTKRPKNKNENFSLLHANDIINANSVGYETQRISPHSNRVAEKTKR